jgi:regulator of replication initiation timing
MLRAIVELTVENRRLRLENDQLRTMNENQARIINTLRRVFRFAGVDTVIEDEMHPDVEEP